MTTRELQRGTPTDRRRPAMAAMYTGLALTVVAIVVAYVDHATADVLAGHIRAGYPTYSPARVDSAATAWLAILTVVGALGLVCWVGSIWALASGRTWARGVATVVFVLAAGVALTDLLIKDTSGDTGLPPLLGWVGVAPSLAGLVAVTLLWRRS
jgi:hypothetical protein